MYGLDHKEVAQSFTLLYRRLAVGGSSLRCGICGLEIRDTADWKSALPATGTPHASRFTHHDTQSTFSL
jgi:hypothetical protein